MSRDQFNVESPAFQYLADDDQRGSMETLMSELESDAAYVAEMERQEQKSREAQAEYDATCREMADGMSLDVPAVPCRSAGEVMARVETGVACSMAAALAVLFR